MQRVMLYYYYPEKLKTAPPKDKPAPDPRGVEEIGLNLERIRLTEKARG